MSRADDDEIKEILTAYGRLLAALKLGPLEVRDESELPYPKQRIAEALLGAWRRHEAHGFSPAEIQGWLIALAQFQPDVGTPICEIASDLARKVTEAREAGRAIDTLALSQGSEAEAREGAWDRRRAHFLPIVNRERTRLLGLLLARP